MIRSFRNKGLRRFAEEGTTRGLSITNAKRVRLLLAALDSGTRPDDMDQPGFRFHKLRGSRAGTYAVDASANYRLTFAWDNNDAIDVDLEDYH